jgi:hypothetical protein
MFGSKETLMRKRYGYNPIQREGINVTATTLAGSSIGSKVYLNKSADDTLRIKTANGRTLTTASNGQWSGEEKMTPTTRRVTPSWAKVLGVIGLLFFLIGILFFFVKENETVLIKTLTITTPDGYVTGTVFTEWQRRPTPSAT